MVSLIFEKGFGYLPDSKFRRWLALVLTFEPGWDRIELEQHPLTVRELSSQELRLLKNVNPDYDIEPLLERFGLGNECFVGQMKGQPVFYQWVLYNRAESAVHVNTRVNMRVDLVLPPQWVYVWDGRTEASYRGRGIQPLAVRALCRQLRAEGCRGAVCLVNVNGASGFRAFSKNGFRHAASLIHLRCFGRDLVLGSYIPNEVSDK